MSVFIDRVKQRWCRE